MDFLSKGLGTVNCLLRPLGLNLQRNCSREDMDALLAAQIRYGRMTCGYPAEGVVFSKDRPMQLHALLSSYFEKVRDPAPLYLIYKALDPRYGKAYAEVIKAFSGRLAGAFPDVSFRETLISVLDKINAEKIFFLVDDIVFIEDMDFADFAKFDTRFFVPSLRMGNNLRYCYAADKNMPLPKFLPGTIADRDKACWRWGDGSYEWGYPLSVDGHLFTTLEVRVMAQRIDFQAPNSFESGLQRFKPLFRKRYGVCYLKSKIVNIPCNIVQKEISNRHGNMDPLFLLEKWNSGLQIDYKKLYGAANISAHADLPVTFTKRDMDAGTV